MDEQPVWMHTRAGPLLSVPYARPTNDITALHGAKVAPALWADMLIDQFDEMLRQSAKEPLVFNLSLHPYLVGHAFRLIHLRRAVAHIAARRDEVWMARAGDIAGHAMTVRPGSPWRNTLCPCGRYFGLDCSSMNSSISVAKPDGLSCERRWSAAGRSARR
jgi:hypothetical protein